MPTPRKLATDLVADLRSREQARPVVSVSGDPDFDIIAVPRYVVVAAANAIELLHQQGAGTLAMAKDLANLIGNMVEMLDPPTAVAGRVRETIAKVNALEDI